MVFFRTLETCSWVCSDPSIVLIMPARVLIRNDVQMANSCKVQVLMTSGSLRARAGQDDLDNYSQILACFCKNSTTLRFILLSLQRLPLRFWCNFQTSFSASVMGSSTFRTFWEGHGRRQRRRHWMEIAVNPQFGSEWPTVILALAVARFQTGRRPEDWPYSGRTYVPASGDRCWRAESSPPGSQKGGSSNGAPRGSTWKNLGTTPGPPRPPLLLLSSESNRCRSSNSALQRRRSTYKKPKKMKKNETFKQFTVPTYRTRPASCT